MARIVGIDIARGLALLGMFLSHALPDDAGGVVGGLADLSAERSRLLFAVTAGLALGLTTGAAAPPVDLVVRRELRRRTAVRALLLIALGYALTGTGVLVHVVLDEYGLAFLLMLPLLFRPSRSLLIGGAVGLLTAPAVMSLLAGTDWARPAPGRRFQLATDWFVTGPYPVLTWLAVFAIGVGLARRDLARPGLIRQMAAAGGLAAFGGLGMSAALGGDGIRSAVASDSAWLTAVGESLFTIGNVGFCLLLTAALIALVRAPWAGVVRTALSPVAAAGSMPLSVYTAHLLVLVALTHNGPQGYLTDDGWAVTIGLIVGAPLAAWLWRRYLGRGPLERVLHAVSDAPGVHVRR